jgi:hypothetical protein
VQAGTGRRERPGVGDRLDDFQLAEIHEPRLWGEGEL